MSLGTPLLLAATLVCLPALALAEDAVAPLPANIIDTVMSGMPTAPLQELRVLRAEVLPAQVTVHHTHRFPVTTYVLDGAMTFTLAGRGSVTVTAGGAFVEPPGIGVIGENPSASVPANVVMFYVSDPATPFLDLVN